MVKPLNKEDEIFPGVVCCLSGKVWLLWRGFWLSPLTRLLFKLLLIYRWEFSFRFSLSLIGIPVLPTYPAPQFLTFYKHTVGFERVVTVLEKMKQLIVLT